MARTQLSVFIDTVSRAEGRLVSYDELAATIWGTDEADAGQKNTLSKLRSQAFHRENVHIENDFGKGYALRVDRPAGGRTVQPVAPVPPPPSPYFERGSAELAELIQPGTVVTLVGQPGVGKSAVARRVAQNLRERGDPFDSVAWVSLAPANAKRALDRAAVERRVARDVGVEGKKLETALEQQRMLIVLDQCEAATAKSLVQSLLERCGSVGILATSEDPLDIPGENVSLVRGLNRAESVALFAELSGFDLAPSDEERLDNLCNGLPRLIKGVAAEVERVGFSALDREPGPSQDAGAIGAFYDRLSERQRDFLSRLTVFAAPFTLSETTAKAIGVVHAELVEHITPLIDFVLSPEDVAVRSRRYRIDPAIRKRAAEDFPNGPDQWGPLRARVARWLTFHRDDRRVAWLERIDRQHDTIVQALRPHYEGDDRAALAGKLLRLVPYWRARGRFQEGLNELEHALQGLPPGETDRRSELHCAAAVLAYHLSRGKIAQRHYKLAPEPQRARAKAWRFYSGRVIDQEVAFDEALMTGSEIPAWLRANVWIRVGWNRYREADYEHAHAAFLEALRVAQDADELHAEGEALIGLAWAARRLCRLEDARVYADHAREHGETLGSLNLRADALNALIEIARYRRDFDAADQWLMEGKRLAERSGLPWIRGWLLGSEAELQRTRARTPAELVEPRKLLIEARKLAGNKTEQGWRDFGIGLIESALDDSARARARFEACLRDAETNRPLDRWQAARARQRLARLDYQEQRPEAERALWTVASEQAGMCVLDDLTWTLLDLQVIAAESGRGELAAELQGLRNGIAGEIGGGLIADDRRRAIGPWAMRARDAFAGAGDATPEWDAIEAGSRSVVDLYRLDGLREAIKRLAGPLG